jgi:hypothetical protein
MHAHAQLLHSIRHCAQLQLAGSAQQAAPALPAAQFSRIPGSGWLLAAHLVHGCLLALHLTECCSWQKVGSADAAVLVVAACVAAAAVVVLTCAAAAVVAAAAVGKVAAFAAAAAGVQVPAFAAAPAAAAAVVMPALPAAVVAAAVSAVGRPILDQGLHRQHSGRQAAHISTSVLLQTLDCIEPTAKAHRECCRDGKTGTLSR